MTSLHGLKVNSAEIENVIAKINGLISNIDTDIPKMENAISDVEANWEGIAGKEYIALMKKNKNLQLVTKQQFELAVEKLRKGKVKIEEQIQYIISQMSNKGGI